LYSSFISLVVIRQRCGQTLARVRCYDSKLKVLSNETILILSNTRELDRVSSTK